jgi:choline-sulfatase
MRILYIDVDSLRPDHLGCYGYHRNTSPHIDAIAREGVRFNNVHTSDAPCLPSRTALYTGRFGILTGVVGHGGTAADLRVQGPSRGFQDWVERQSLPAVLQQLGLHTAQISPFGPRHAARQFLAGFREIHDSGGRGMESAELVQPIALKWMRENGARDDWFLHVNFWDPHTPYRAPEAFGHPFQDDPLPAWITDEVLRRHIGMPGPHSAQDISMWHGKEDPHYPRQPGSITDRAGLRRLFDGYDTGVRYADAMIGELVAALKAAGVYDETAIIISSDHGENLGELGIYAEHGTADSVTCRVPLIVKWPGKARGEARDGLHYSLDLAPTLAALLGRDPEECWDGTSFAPALEPGAEDPGRTELILSQCAHVCQRSVRWDDYLYVRTYHDGYRLFPKELLFDLRADLHEQNDLAAARPDLCREALSRLCEWHDARMFDLAGLGYTEDPLWTVIREGGPMHARDSVLAETGYCDRLQATGRGWAIPEYRRRHPRAFPPRPPTS